MSKLEFSPLKAPVWPGFLSVILSLWVQRWPNLLPVQRAGSWRPLRGHRERGKRSSAFPKPQPVLRTAQVQSVPGPSVRAVTSPQHWQHWHERLSARGSRVYLKPPGLCWVISVAAAPAGAQGRGTRFFSCTSSALRSRQNLQYLPHSWPFLLLLNACRHHPLSRNKWEKVLPQSQILHTGLALQGTTTRNPQQFWAYMQQQQKKIVKTQDSNTPEAAFFSPPTKPLNRETKQFLKHTFPFFSTSSLLQKK